MSSQPLAIARGFLAKALARAESSLARGGDAEIRLPLNRTQCPGFPELRNLDAALAFRAELALAERDGAIRCVLRRRQQPPDDVEAIVVTDIQRLATRLGVELRATRTSLAREALSGALGEYRVLELVLEHWRAGKQVRGRIPDEDTVQALLDAIAVRSTRAGRADEVLLRRESRRLFRDSKRIEALGVWLEILQEGGLQSSGLKQEDIFSGLGLRKEPQPFLIAGDVLASNGEEESILFRPYHGLPVEHLRGIRFSQRPSCVLTVENKSSFHEAALLAKGSSACVIYTGGMPSPAWRAAYGLVLSALPAGVPVYHFGDVDVGGFRIANAIAAVAREHGIALRHWMMDPAALRQEGYDLDPATSSQANRMAASCTELGWDDIVQSLQDQPGMLEQELIVTRLPVVN